MTNTNIIIYIRIYLLRTLKFGIFVYVYGYALFIFIVGWHSTLLQTYTCIKPLQQYRKKIWTQKLTQTPNDRSYISTGRPFKHKIPIRQPICHLYNRILEITPLLYKRARESEILKYTSNIHLNVQYTYVITTITVIVFIIIVILSI